MFSEALMHRMEALEAAKADLTTRIEMEKLEKPKISEKEMTFFLHRFRKLNPNIEAHRQTLIDTFVNAVYVYDDKLLLTFNFKDGTKTISFADVETATGESGSDMNCLGAPQKATPNRGGLLWCREGFPRLSRCSGTIRFLLTTLIVKNKKLTNQQMRDRFLLTLKYQQTGGAMPNIRIITDSSSDIAPGAISGVTVLPMTVRFGDREYRDGVDLSHREFYEKLIESDELPVTSLISPGDFENAFREAVRAGQQVIAITLSSKLSGTYQSAMLAAEEFPGKVFVVDSLTAAVGEQILVRYCAQMVSAGLPAEVIVEILETDKRRIHTMALLDTLEYLKKGGRISKSVAFVGGMLSIKPVAAIENGEVTMLGTARGSKNGNNYLIREIEKTNGVDFTKPVALGYTGLSDHLLQKYLQDSRSLWEGHEEAIRVSSIGGTIGTHVGPNAVAVSFFAL